MPFVEIDENRFQINYAVDNNPFGVNGLFVDVISPDVFYKLKIDYKNYSEIEQWEIDEEFQQEILQKRQLETIVTNKIKNVRELIIPTDLLYRSVFMSAISECINALIIKPSYETIIEIVDVLNKYQPPEWFSDNDVKDINDLKNQILTILQED